MLPCTSAHVHGPHRQRLCHRGGVLNGMRDRSGAPNLRVRALALVLALLLAGPLTVLLVRALLRLAQL